MALQSLDGMADGRMGEEKFARGLGKTARFGQAGQGVYLAGIKETLTYCELHSSFL